MRCDHELLALTADFLETCDQEILQEINGQRIYRMKYKGKKGNYAFQGLCNTPYILYSEGRINKKESTALVHIYTAMFSDALPWQYYWAKGLKAPRIKWLRDNSKI